VPSTFFRSANILRYTHFANTRLYTKASDAALEGPAMAYLNSMIDSFLCSGVHFICFCHHSEGQPFFAVIIFGSFLSPFTNGIAMSPSLFTTPLRRTLNWQEPSCMINEIMDLFMLYGTCFNATKLLFDGSIWGISGRSWKHPPRLPLEASVAYFKGGRYIVRCIRSIPAEDIDLMSKSWKHLFLEASTRANRDCAFPKSVIGNSR